MLSDPVTSAHASLVSIDPVIASQITATSASTSSYPHSHSHSHSRNNSNPTKSVKKAPATLPARGHVRNQSAPLHYSGSHKRSNSLRRAKNSTEVLRQHAIRPGKRPPPLEHSQDSRSGRSFTVGSVGTGGLLYLRPSVQQNLSPQPLFALQVPLTAPPDLSTTVGDSNVARSARSQSPVRPVPSVSPNRSLRKRMRRPTAETIRSRQGRSQSFSTVDEQCHTVNGTRTRVMKVVINRTSEEEPRPRPSYDAVSEVAELPGLAMPTLQVSIPHYRIGTPHFSDHGTAMLRTSYAHNSLDASDPTAGQDQAEKRQKGPPPSHAKTFARMVTSETPAFWRGSHVQKPRPTTTSSASAKTDSTIREPIHPEIFDELAAMYDDPAVVRYSQNVREITAATPARIIAQISSESFMDYELVSDFFLTFRSYISSFAVLDLLLARLRWAIDRQEDDGRIIRVRTFAALRHWILNYFLDDFVPDRKLRTRFCNEINRMYADVASRRSNGTSDLKVLRDLKRCWNGRCSMFWNPENFVSDLDQDGDIQPGGFDEEAFISADHLTSPLASPRPIAKRPSNTSWIEPASPQMYDVQQQNHGSPGKQASILSSPSIQAKSCSIAKVLLKPHTHNDTSPTAQASHPVPVLLRREKAPASLHVQTAAHRRGGGSIDSDREPTPRDQDLEMALLTYPGSVIRGAAFTPRAPFVQIASSPTHSNFPKHQTSGPDVRNGRSMVSPTSAQNGAAVKTILGSLRRVLAGRQAHSDVALGPVSGPLPLQDSQRLPRTALPLNMSKSYDELRARGHAPSKAQVRIDILCAQALHSHERVFPTSRAVGIAELGQPVPSPAVISPGPRDLNPDLPAIHASKGRLRSQTTMTTQSGNIVIANDTGIGVPTMSGAIGPLPPPPVDWQAETPMLDHLSGFEVQQSHDHEKAGPTSTLRSSDLFTPTEMAVAQPGPVDEGRVKENLPSPRAPPSLTDQTVSSVTQSSAALRNAKSFQSSIQPEPSMMTVTSPSTAEDEVEGATREDETRLHAPALRRKPGGDLRMAENVHDLSRENHHTSFDTITTGLGSPGGVEIEREQGQMSDKKVSMIHTHSSQHLRPSFQAAVAGLVGMPDEDDGGLEVALMKLEGRYEKRSPPIDQHPVDAMRQMPEVVSGMPATAEPTAQQMQSVAQDRPSSRASSILGLPLTANEGSGQFDEHAPSQQTSEPQPQHQPLPKSTPDSLRPQPGFDNEGNAIPAWVAVPQTIDLDEARQGGSADDTAESFLLDEGENLSDLSSEISVDVIRDHSDTDKSIQPMIAAPGTALSGLEIPSHPLTHASIINLSPSPVDKSEPGPSSEARNGGAREARFEPTNMAGVPAHLPFVLGCDSQVLAQQMTLIEKSALTEIEWFDLVDMRWENTSSHVLDWAEYLARGNARGVDLVIARFNLVSRWVRSEIVLTQDADERAQVIAKLIHVAAHARRLRNYTTMVQLTIGLTSSDVTRLAKTWDKVSGPDRSLLKNMERLVQPLRNFQHLRAEIEGSDFSDGCIPFLGLYVHDLTYNAQKPAQVASNHGSEPLINFERYRTTASIVKNLLRLIDASARYNFEPVKGVIDRCLWMTALTDEKIWQMSKVLEE